MKQILFGLIGIFSVLTLNLSISAQNEFINSNENSFLSENIKIDEFGSVGNCDLSSRLHDAVIRLKEYPNAKIYIIHYRGSDILPSQYNSSRAEIYYERYLTNVLSLASERFSIIHGGFRKKQGTEIWLTSEGATPPEPSDTVPAPEIPRGKTYLYGKEYIELYDDNQSETSLKRELVLPHILEREKAEMEAVLAENEQSSENADSESVVDPEAEVAEKTLSDEEREQQRFSWVSYRFAEAVKNEKGSRGVILFYADDQYHDVAKLQALLEEGKIKIAASKELPLERFKIVFGGYRNFIELEMWVVPAGKEMPTATPEERPVEEQEVVETVNN